jgi:hypothetical protein
VRAHFRLGEDDAIMHQPDRMPAAWLPAAGDPSSPSGARIGKRRQFKVFKPLAEVGEEDLPPWWMKSALIHDDYAECSCC